VLVSMCNFFLKIYIYIYIYNKSVNAWYVTLQGLALPEDKLAELIPQLAATTLEVFHHHNKRRQINLYKINGRPDARRRLNGHPQRLMGRPRRNICGIWRRSKNAPRLKRFLSTRISSFSTTTTCSRLPILMLSPGL
jgi:hypothetical protein